MATALVLQLLLGFILGSLAVDTHSCKDLKAHMPMSARVFTPAPAGSYPVVVFHHGFLLSNQDYSTMLQDIANKGFVVAAPQIDSYWPPQDATPEIRKAFSFVNWLHTHLEDFLIECMGCPEVKPDFSKLVGMGHSRGGKVTFALAMGLGVEKRVPYTAVIGIDPVDRAVLRSLSPEVLKQNEFDLPYPTLLVGSGLGPEGGVMSCAPQQYGYKAFFSKSSAPAFQFDAPEDGHMDFLDDGAAWIQSLPCSSGKLARARSIATNTSVAFLEAVLYGSCANFLKLLPAATNTTGYMISCKNPSYSDV